MVMRERCNARRYTLAMAAAILLVAFPAAAEFYSWIDEGGQKRISNIPPQGIRKDGTVVDSYHPLSVTAQHARMREKLKEQAAAIEQARAETAATKDPVGQLLPFPPDFLKSDGGP